MSDDGDYDGDFDGADGDADDDGIQDDRELDSDREDAFGHEAVQINGEWFTQTQDPFGNTVLVDGDRNVVATVESDGDIRMENGPTYTSMDEPIVGRGFYRGTDGSTLTPTDGPTGITDNVIDNSSNVDSETPDADTIDAAGEVTPIDADDGEAGDVGDGADADGRMADAGSTTLTRRRAPVRAATPAVDPYYRRRQNREGLGCFFPYFFLFYQMASIFGISALFYFQSYGFGLSHWEAVIGVFLVTGFVYLINALLWLISGRLFLLFDMTKADLFAWVMTVIMIVTPAIVAFGMIFAN